MIKSQEVCWSRKTSSFGNRRLLLYMGVGGGISSSCCCLVHGVGITTGCQASRQSDIWGEDLANLYHLCLHVWNGDFPLSEEGMLTDFSDDILHTIHLTRPLAHLMNLKRSC